MTSFKNKPSANTYINVWDALVMVVVCTYYLTVSKNLLWLQIFMFVLSLIALGLAFVCPESPKWHIVNGRSSEAIKILNRIAAMNGREERIPSDARFVLDPTNYNDQAVDNAPVLEDFSRSAV